MSSTYWPRRLLVTGGAGFIGSNFVRYWLSKHRNGRLVVLDALTYAGNRSNLDGLEERPEFCFIQGDIRDQNLVEEILTDEQIDTVVHLAAETHVDRSIRGPDAFIDTNVVGTHSLLKAARSVWIEEGGKPISHRFHHVSTDEVYGSLEPGEPAFTEVSPYQPNSPYAASKAASDHLVRAYYRTYGLQATISNCSNNYGPYQFPEKLIPLCIINLLSGKELPVYGDGLNIRDWLHVNDHCHGIEVILEHGLAGETYNVGGGQERNNLEVVEELCALMDQYRPTSAPHNRQISFVTDRLGHDRRYAINATKLSSSLGYQASKVFETGLYETFNWYLSHREWWAPLLGQEYQTWIKEQYPAHAQTDRTGR